MVLKPHVVQAFATIGITEQTPHAIAQKAYKTLALRWHPDKNGGNPAATEKFQEVGAAWDICQKHYEKPESSHILEPGASSGNSFSSTRYSFDDDIPLDDEERAYYYFFMFQEVFMGRFTRSSGQRYRHQRSGGAGAGVYSFSGDFAESQKRQQSNSERQARDKEEYEKRRREFELEIEAEEREQARVAREKALAQKRLTSAYVEAFKSARAGNSALVRKIVEDYDLDVNGRETMPKQPLKKPNVPINVETLLHTSARACDAELMLFLLQRGGNPAALNGSRLSPFHVAVQYGNVPIACLFLSRRGKFAGDGCHPSKATLGGQTPLQLAITSGSAEMVTLLVKEATVHDVERCWRQKTLPSELRDILLTKNGFTDPDAGPYAGMSKKALRKLEKEGKERREAEEKEKRLAEERARAAENHRRKEERAAKHAAQVAADQEVERKRRQEEEAEAEREARQAETNRLAVIEAKCQAEAGRRAEVEAEARRKSAEEARRLAERREVTRRQAEEQGQKKAEAKRKQGEAEAAAAAARELETRHIEESALRKVQEEERIRRADETILEAKRQRQTAAKRLETERRLKAQAEGHRRQQEQVEQARQIEAAKQKQIEEAAQLERTKAADALESKREGQMRRRAEQSARDKARHAQKREELRLGRERERREQEVANNTETPATPESLVQGESNHRNGRSSDPDVLQRYLDSAPADTISGLIGRRAPSVPRYTRPSIVTPQPQQSYPDTFNLVSPPMTPEDLQTCATADDLFPIERRSRPSDVSASVSISPRKSRNPSRTPVSRQVRAICMFYRQGKCRNGDACQFRHEDGLGGPSRGRGTWRDRGRTSGGSGRDDLAAQLACQNTEIRRLAAELAEVRGGKSY